MNRTHRSTLKIAGILITLTVTAFLLYAFMFGFTPGNSSKYSVANTPALSYSPISGKTLYFLGSSITYGSASEGESYVDYI